MKKRRGMEHHQTPNRGNQRPFVHFFGPNLLDLRAARMLRHSSSVPCDSAGEAFVRE